MTATQVTVVTNSYMSPHGTRCTARPRMTTPRMCAASPSDGQPEPAWTQRLASPARAGRPAAAGPGPRGVRRAGVPGLGPGLASPVRRATLAAPSPRGTRSAAGTVPAPAFGGPAACRPNAKSAAKASTARK